MAIDPRIIQSFLANLSAPGLNRPLGPGDVVPYLGANPNAQGVADVQTATPGPSFSPLGASPFQAGSLLANLGSILPAIARAQQGLANANVPSGQGNALPSTYAATPGIGSVDVNNALAAVNAPSAGGVLPTNVQPVGGTGPAAAPAPAAPTASVGGGVAGVSGDTGIGIGTGTGVGAPGNAGAVAGEAAGGPGAPGTPGGADAPGVGVGGPSDGGATILCGWTISRLELAPRERRLVLAWWHRTKEHLLAQERGESDYRAYCEVATEVTQLLDAVPAELRAEALAWLKALLVDPVLKDSSWTPERAGSGLTVLATAAVLLAHACHIEVPEHSGWWLADPRELLSRVPLPAHDARESLTGA